MPPSSPADSVTGLAPVRCALLSLVLALVFAAPARAAIDVYVEIDGIPGHSDSVQHPNAFHVSSMDFALKQPAATPAVVPVGDTVFSNLTIQKGVDQSSPALFLNSALGTISPTVMVYIHKAGGTAGGAASDFLVLTFRHVYIAGYSVTQLADSGLLQETVSLSFSAVFEQYKEYSGNDGTATAASRGGWDLRTNKEATN